MGRGPQTCGVAALHRHVRDELLQVIVGDVSWSAGSESQPCSSKAAVYERGQLVLARKVAVVSDMCMCMCMHMHIVMCVWAGAAWADLLYTALPLLFAHCWHIPLCNRKLLYI